MVTLNNREIAIIIWVLLGLGYLAISPKLKNVRLAVPNLIKSTFAKPLVRLYFTILIYAIIEIVLLHYFGLWDFTQIKNTIIWFVAIAIFSSFQIYNIEDTKKYFLKVLWNACSIVAVLKFVVNLYPFDLIFEIILVPVYCFAVVVYVISERNEKTLIISRAMQYALLIVGVFLISRAIYTTMISLLQNVPQPIVSNFITPPLLTVLFLPFLFILLLSDVYGRAFLKINYHFKSKFKSKLTKLIAIILFNFNFHLVERWGNHLVHVNANSIIDIYKSFLTIYKMRYSERNPKKYSKEKGWSPYIVKRYLEPVGLQTGHYHPSFDEWYASSPLIELDDSYSPSIIAYYVEGIKDYANILKLKLNVNDSEFSESSLMEMASYSDLLYSSVFSKPLPHDIQNSIKQGLESTFIENQAEILLLKDVWQEHSRNGYDYKFIIKHKNHLTS
ncbi:MAG: hypothetical protein ACI8PB_001189 [Desulforhopalus sp.]|jgi:hypothetical protein